ncbi:DUF6069 family protein [Jiangella endophytica]|uniref:DUF6069 family protein n=1 Tax=Jiangella endophytica TaxID=1623398 RepID=UPI000E3437B3|nr:DUF6069 family protein [Jiangella endophytica]
MPRHHPDTEEAPAATRRGRDRAAGVAATVVAAVLVWVVAEPVLGHDLVVEQPGQDARDLGAGAFVFFSLAAALLGWALLAVLERFTARARSIWTIVAIGVLAVSFLPFFGIEASNATIVTLTLAHVAVGAVLVTAFRRTGAAGR